MNTPSSSFVGPVLLVLAEEVDRLRPELADGLEAAGILQPEPTWMASFERHVRLAVRQGAAAHDDDLAVGEFMLWLGHRLHLGHGMLLKSSFVGDVEGLMADLVGQGFLRLMGLGASADQRPSDWPIIMIEEAVLKEDPAYYVRFKVMDRLGAAEYEAQAPGTAS